MSVTTKDDRKILVPFDKREGISLGEAAKRAGKSESTHALLVRRSRARPARWGRHMDGQQGRAGDVP
jgi:transposase